MTFDKKMKLLSLIVTVLVTSSVLAWSEEAETFASRDYKSLAHFGIPAEFFTDHYYFPANYITNYEVKDKKAKLSHSEKLSAALLIIAADHATTEKYHQSYGVSMRSPLMILLANNFQGLEAVEPSHDVNEGALPIRDLGCFFRTWLREALSQDAQNARIKKFFEDARKQRAEQDAAGNPLPDM